jgi:hypothetical protein
MRPKHPPTTRKRWTRTIGLILLLCAICWLGVALGRLALAGFRVQADLRSLERLAQAPIEAIEVQEAAGLLRATRADVQALHIAARPFLWLAPHLGWLPRYGPDIRAAPVLLEIAHGLTAAGDEAIEPLLPLVGQVSGREDNDRGQVLGRGLAVLHAARPQLMDALSHARAAQVARERLQAEGLNPRLREVVERLDRYLPLMERAIGGSILLPELLGVDAPRTWLALVQNEDELRATGGFISGVARLTVERGALLELGFEDSYAVDDFSRAYPSPPEPLQTYMLSEQWVFRDSNWSPDFPTSARAAIDLYAISRDAQIDGVIALDQQAIRFLVEALGPLSIEGYPDPVTGENVIQMARRAWDPGTEVAGDWWRHRKDFMAAVFEATARRLESGLDRAALIPLARAALRALDEKHLLLYLQDEQMATLLSDLGWDGALLRRPGDYLMVVDTNMGFNKANALVEQSLEYVVDLTEPDRPRARLTVRHHHPLEQSNAPCRQEPRYDETYEQMAERCYWDYLRVYVPSASVLADAIPHSVSGSELLSGHPSPAQVRVGPPEHGRNIFATFLLLRPSETVETRLTYALPADVLQVRDQELEYALLIQKQPGTRAVPLRVQILLPPGASLIESEPEPAFGAGSRLEYAFELLTDQSLWVTFGSPTVRTSGGSAIPSRHVRSLYPLPPNRYRQ